MELLNHFHQLSLHPVNAKELKGLILQLAVQGKLTSDWRLQNSTIDSCHELLRQIEQEKRKLVREKKIKKEKPLPELAISLDEFVLPEKWIMVQIPQIVNAAGLYTDGDWVESKDQDPDGKVRLLQLADVGDGEFRDRSNRFINEQTFQRLNCNEVRKGDVLMARMPDPLGRCCIMPLEDQKYVTVVDVCIIRPHQAIFNKWLMHTINSSFVRQQVSGLATGTTRQRISRGNISRLAIPLPPLEEQKAIVEIVEQLFEEVEQLEQLTEDRIQLKLDYGVSVLHQLTNGDTETEWQKLQPHFHAFFNEEENIKKLRETILQLAVQGKLTSKWRDANKDVEPASELLERIKAEKVKLIKDKKIKKENPLPPIAENEIPYELPEGWVWCRFGDLITFLNGYAFKSTTYVANSNYQVIRLGNVKNDRFLIDIKEAYVPESIGIETLDYQLFEDDILTTLTGTKDKRDYCFTCLVKEDHLKDRVLLLNQRVGCIRMIFKEQSELANKFLKSEVILDQLFETETGTANQGNIGSTSFKNIMFPLPPLEEQKATVSKVNALMALCDELEAQVQESKAQAEQLMQSVLREVFIKC